MNTFLDAIAADPQTKARILAVYGTETQLLAEVRQAISMRVQHAERRAAQEAMPQPEALAF